MMVSSALPDLTMISVKVFCFGIELGTCEQLGHAENAVHWRPDLVAHIGEEFGFGAVGEHGPALRLLKLLLALLLLGHVDRRAEQIERAVRGDHRALARHLVAHAAVQVGDGFLDFPALARAQYGAVVFHEGETVATRDLEVGPADRLVVGNAGQLRPVLVDVDELQILALGVDRHRHIVDRLRNISFSRWLSLSRASRAFISVMSVLDPMRCTDPSLATSRLFLAISWREVPSRCVSVSSTSLATPVTQNREVALGEIPRPRRRRNRGQCVRIACSLEMPVSSVQALLTNSKVRSSDLT